MISKGIVDLHGGELTVFSEGINKGATFTISLPGVRRKAKPPELMAECSINRPADIPFNNTNAEIPKKVTIQPVANSNDRNQVPTEQSSLRILVVDDSSTNRKLTFVPLEFCV